MMIVKSFQYENESMRQVINRQNDKYGWVVKKNKLSIAANLILSAGYWMGYVLAFIYGIFKLSKISFGTFTAFLQLVGQIQDPFIGVARSIPQMVSCLASVERLMELEALKDEPQDNRDVPLTHGIKALTLEHVTFGYESDKAILSDISLMIESSKTVALIGSSGEGKTTLMRLLLSLLTPECGSIRLSLPAKSQFRYPPPPEAFSHMCHRGIPCSPGRSLIISRWRNTI
jgi:ABC-type multidrug transport system fused ATPase/permease subunit